MATTREYHTYGMERTTVYLTAEQAAALRRTSRATGRSQSQLIREGVDLVTGARPGLRFRSMGAGRRSDDDPAIRGWSAEELYEHVMGQTWRDRHR